MLLEARPIPQYNISRVLTRINKFGNDGCWDWIGHIDNYGYGTYGKQNHIAHRVVYQLLVAQLGAEDSIDHLCRNRSCVNPEHLEVVELSVNILRSNNPYALNKRKTHCKHGHEFDSKNTYIHTKSGNRQCRKCRLLTSKQFLERTRNLNCL